jgi:hypothetical protein
MRPIVNIVIHYDSDIKSCGFREIFGEMGFGKKKANFLLRRSSDARRWDFQVKKLSISNFKKINHPEFYDYYKVFKWLGEATPRLVNSI